MYAHQGLVGERAKLAVKLERIRGGKATLPIVSFRMDNEREDPHLLSARPISGSYSGFPTILEEAGCGSFVPASDTDALLHALHQYQVMSPKTLAQMGEKVRPWLY